MIRNLLLVGLGGGVGSIARYLCQKWFTENHPTLFPWGTFFVNILGCFLIGFIYQLSNNASWLSPQARLLLATGFCGGFTTFSAFALENVTLAQDGHATYLVIYIAASVVAGIASVFAGIGLARLA